MDRYIVRRLLAAFIVVSVCFTGYTLSKVMGSNTPAFDLAIENIAVNFTLDRTMHIDTQTTDRAFIIHSDHLEIRSQYLTLWNFNESYDHEDVNLVIGDYCYAVVPAENLTLNNITEINRFQLSSWNGTVTVQTSEYGTDRMTLEVNSTGNPSLFIRAVGLTLGHEYRVILDGVPRGHVHVNWLRYFEYNYTGPWSNHTITFLNIGSITEVPNLWLILCESFLILGVCVVVIRNMILPLRKKDLTQDQMTKVLIKAAIYIVAAVGLIVIVFKLFVGV